MFSNLIFINTNKSSSENLFNDVIYKLSVIFLAGLGFIKVFGSLRSVKKIFSKLFENQNIRNILVDQNFMDELNSIGKNSKTKTSKTNKRNRSTPKTVLKTKTKNDEDEESDDDDDDETFDESEILASNKKCCGKCCGKKKH